MYIKNHQLTPAQQITSPNYDQRSDPTDISLIVIHCISLPEGQFDTPYIDQLFTNQLKATEHVSFAEICHLEVSSHILIKRNGAIKQYVPFDQRAWHAGVSCYKGREKCNDFSIGIELEGTIDTRYTEIQYQQLADLAYCLMQTYDKLCPENITGHSNIAPQRKADPGIFFDWVKFYRLLNLRLGTSDQQNTD
ncbi:MAG: 1,6-anhydro-N-acetylmuramyl-L-alanine amidase AmpD [Methylococcaceae bacterium]|nr:1,6-anhydro-N-acetylmuramyl-L-alanine amidase AmpD [Methylococcaceae bacterium]